MSVELRDAAARLEHWTRDALAFWADVQEPSGAWPEELHGDGTPNTAMVRRHRVQARQVYKYALGTRLGWYDGAEIVRRTVDFMWEAGRGDEPGLLHRLNADGSVADASRDLYDHAFYLLALGWAEATVGGQSERLRELWAFIESLREETGGFAEGPDKTLPRRQNPHMHLFEASMNLHQLGIAGDWFGRAGALHGLFRKHFQDRGTVHEFFGTDWETLAGNTEPGHGCEWVWLLGLWRRLGGDVDSAVQARLYQNALLSGGVWLWDAVDANGEPVRETSRLWVQTELVKAHLAMSERGVPGAMEMAAAGIDGLLAEWLAPSESPRGTWIDKRGACGQRLSMSVPTSTFYHIITIAAEAVRVSRLL